MNTRMVAWSLGLVGLCSLAGCGWERPFRSPLCPCKRLASGCGGSCAGNRRSVRAEIVETVAVPADQKWEGTVVASIEPTKQDLPLLEVDPPKSIASPTLPAIRSRHRDQAASSPVADDAQSTLTVPLLKKIEVLPTTPKGEDKIVDVSANNAKSVAQPPAAPVKSNNADEGEAELVDAMNRLFSKGDDKIAPLQSTHIPYGQETGYQQLTGQLQQWRKTWRLRYAAVGAEESHGGSVVLEGLADARKLRDGQNARVRGKLVPSENRQDSPRYVVQSIEVLE